MDVRRGLCDCIGKFGSNRDMGVDENDQDQLDEKKNEYNQVKNDKYYKILMKKGIYWTRYNIFI